MYVTVRKDETLKAKKGVQVGAAEHELGNMVEHNKMEQKYGKLLHELANDEDGLSVIS